jgi:hypothetical protein
MTLFTCLLHFGCSNIDPSTPLYLAAYYKSQQASRTCRALHLIEKMFGFLSGNIWFELAVLFFGKGQCLGLGPCVLVWIPPGVAVCFAFILFIQDGDRHWLLWLQGWIKCAEIVYNILCNSESKFIAKLPLAIFFEILAKFWIFKRFSFWQCKLSAYLDCKILCPNFWNFRKLIGILIYNWLLTSP